MEYYFADNALRLYQEYALDALVNERVRGDPHSVYRQQADVRLADEAVTHVLAKRPEWRAHCLLVLPWRELEPIGDYPAMLRFLRDIYVYEVPRASRVERFIVPSDPHRLHLLTKKIGDYTLSLRPLRHVIDPRTMAGEVYGGTLYIVEI